MQQTERPLEASSSDRARLETLLTGVAAGDRDALGRLYADTRGAVYAMAVGILKNAQEAQDVTQDVFVRIWDRAGQYRPGGSPMGWVLTLARNLALMRLRQTGRVSSLDDDAWEAVPAQAPGVAPEERAVLQTALAALTDQERQIVLLHAASGLKHREIGQILDMPVATVLSKYHRALKKLRVRLEGDDAS